MSLISKNSGEICYAGAVLTGVYEQYQGFDRYADLCDVWTGTRVTTIRVGSGYCDQSVSYYSVVEDATPEVRAAAKAWKAEQSRFRWEAEEKCRAEREAKTIAKGKLLCVVKGRKVPVGTQGVCIWHGEGKYGRRVGIKQASGEVVWTAATNVEVLAA